MGEVHGGGSWEDVRGVRSEGSCLWVDGMAGKRFLIFYEKDEERLQAKREWKLVIRQETTKENPKQTSDTAACMSKSRCQRI